MLNSDHAAPLKDSTPEYWEHAARTNPFDLVRTGWTEADFDTRTDESLCGTMEFRPDDVVLDYGCGPGYTCRMVAPKVKAYVGIDYARSMLEIARRRNARFANASFVWNDGITIPFDDTTFDCIYCDLVLQHVVRSDTAKILAEMRRVLKPDGRAAVQVLSTERAHLYGPQFTFTVDELKALLPGWAVAPDPEWRWHYIICRFPC